MKLHDHIERFLNRFSKRHWPIIGIAALVITAFEIFEPIQKNEPITDPFHILELAAYILVLLLVGLLMNYLAEQSSVLNDNMEILKYKHNLSLDFIQPEDWEMLTTKLVTLPSTIVEVTASRLHVRSLTSDQFELVALWDVDESSKSNFCQECLEEEIARERAEYDFTPCQHASTVFEPAIQAQEYCLPIFYANQLLALIQFKLKIGDELSPKQKEIFESIRPEIALALRVNQKKKNLFELQLTERALAERHIISSYLHDNLSQNLAYLCMKLDQLSVDEDLLPGGQIQSDLEKMKDTANQSYEIARGMIETNYLKTIPRLNNLFSEYARKISQRANFEISIERVGDPLPILPEVQRAVFYVFQEALSNIEKYARADQVNVIVKWSEDNLVVTVSDNGIGFNPHKIDGTKHFGLEIMKERLAKINGQLTIVSSETCGTTVTFSSPLQLDIIRGNLEEGG
jgi:signal transduction histidine kinase